MMRYLRALADKDIALDRSMIPLGSCTMKLNAAAEMESITWPEFGRQHPFAPASDTAGLRQLVADLQSWLVLITGYDAVSLQPNAGSQGEYAGLLAIHEYHASRGEPHRDICLIRPARTAPMPRQPPWPACAWWWWTATTTATSTSMTCALRSGSMPSGCRR